MKRSRIGKSKIKSRTSKKRGSRKRKTRAFNRKESYDKHAGHFNYKSLKGLTHSQIRAEEKRLRRWLEKKTKKSWDVGAANSLPIAVLVKSYNNLKKKNFNGW